MNFLRMYYDRLLAVLAFLFVVVALFLLIFRIGKMGEDFSRDNPIPDKTPLVKPFDFTGIDGMVQQIEYPAEWQTNTHRLFQPPLMKVDPDTQRPIPVYIPSDAVSTGPGGIPVDWYKRYDLDFKNPNIHLEDTDGDTYRNSDEYAGESNPMDPVSRPSPANKVRILEIYQKDFPYTFVAYSEGGTDQNPVFNVQLNHVKTRNTELITVGSRFGGREKKDYLLKSLNKKTQRRFNPGLNKEVEEDASTITIVDKSGQELVLEKNRAGKTNEWYAKLIYLRDGKEFEVEEGDELVLEEKKFTVQRILPKTTVDIPVGSVVISTTDESTRTTITYELKPFNPKEDKKGEAALTETAPEAPPPASRAPTGIRDRRTTGGQ